MLTDAGALAAIEAVFVECFRSFAVLRNARAFEEDGVSGVVTEVPHTFFNGIGATRLTTDVEHRIDTTIDLYRAKARTFRWWISPSTQPPGLVEILRTRGLRHVWDSEGMAADLTTFDPARPEIDAEIQRVANRSHLADWVTVMSSVFSFPPGGETVWMDAHSELGFGGDSPWHHFVAHSDGKPVATASLLLRGRLAGIYHVGTLAEARGRGIGRAITEEAMRFAGEAGATTAVLQASAMGAPVYRSIGFRQYCNLTLYDWKPQA